MDFGDFSRKKPIDTRTQIGRFFISTGTLNSKLVALTELSILWKPFQDKIYTFEIFWAVQQNFIF